jgi:hypothetical protein
MEGGRLILFVIQDQLSSSKSVFKAGAETRSSPQLKKLNLLNRLGFCEGGGR